MTTLVTGKGRTSGALAKLLHDANRPFIVTTRSGNADGPYNTVKFDFFDEETFANPFKADANIDRVYLLYPPGRLDALAQLDKFIKFAISKGVKRIVLLSATQVPSQDVPAGGFHKYFTGNGVDYAVLRPTWFIQNFGTMFVKSISEQNQIFSATGDGRLPFVSTEDVAQAAFDALTAEKGPNTEVFVFGPDLLSYAEVAEIISSVLGREITHKRFTTEELSNLYCQFGVDQVYASALASLEGDRAAKGSEEAFFNSKDINKFMGKHTLAEYIEANKALYITK